MGSLGRSPVLQPRGTCARRLPQEVGVFERTVRPLPVESGNNDEVHGIGRSLVHGLRSYGQSARAINDREPEPAPILGGANQRGPGDSLGTHRVWESHAVIDTTCGLSEVPDAIDRVGKRHTRGKIVFSL